MSIDIYKLLNKELVEKVQELKKANEFLQKEIIALHARHFEENQLRLEERQTIKSILSRLKANINDADLFFNDDDMISRGTRSTGSELQRTRPSGVTTRSPLRQSNSEFPIETQGDQSPGTESNSEQIASEMASDRSTANPWGFDIIEEKSSHSDSDEYTVIHLSRLSLNDKPIQTKMDQISFRKTVLLSPVPVIHLTSSDECSESTRESIETLRSSAGSIEEETLRNSRNILTTPSILSNQSNLTILDFDLKTVHSTPIPKANESVKEEIIDTSKETNNNTIISRMLRQRRNTSSISYAEPSLSRKLRNENEIKKKSRKGKKKK